MYKYSTLCYSNLFLGLTLVSSEKAFRYHDVELPLYTISLISFGGLLAFVMEVFEFYIVTKASSLTLSIVGITKVSTYIKLIHIFHDSLNTGNLCHNAGCCI